MEIAVTYGNVILCRVRIALLPVQGVGWRGEVWGGVKDGVKWERKTEKRRSRMRNETDLEMTSKKIPMKKKSTKDL